MLGRVLLTTALASFSLLVAAQTPKVKVTKFENPPARVFYFEDSPVRKMDGCLKERLLI